METSNHLQTLRKIKLERGLSNNKSNTFSELDKDLLSLMKKDKDYSSYFENSDMINEV